jgi:DNA-binding XRE family transcriptional regulator
MPRRPNPLDPSSSPLALFGSELRFLRERAGLSQDQAGTKANYSGSHIGSVERAEDMPLRAFAVKMDQVLDGDGILPRLWDGLLKRSVHGGSVRRDGGARDHDGRAGGPGDTDQTVRVDPVAGAAGRSVPRDNGGNCVQVAVLSAAAVTR